MDVDPNDGAPEEPSAHAGTEAPYHAQLPFVKRFPTGAAGTPIPNMGQAMPSFQALHNNLGLENIWHPFRLQCDWDFARWAKNRGPSSTSVTELLTINGVVDKLGLSYHNSRELNCIIDEEMPGRPKFKCEEVRIGGESYDFHFREIIPCLRALFGDPRFSNHLALAPERHYQDAGHTTQVFSEMHTGKWWWSVQHSLESRKPGATSAYPIYLTIGNIPKAIRNKPTQQAQLLMGYIPTTKLKSIKNKTAQRRALANLFHSCVRKLLQPIQSYGETGIAMATGNGTWYRCHPILATFVGDYPEQLLVTCTQYGRCPKCVVPQEEIGNGMTFPLCDFGEAVDVFSLSDSDPTVFHTACRNASFKPMYHPFWESLPFTNIFLSITPDILHQLHQGVFKHMASWLADLAWEEIDTRCSYLLPNHNARHFHNGFTWFSRITGQEHKDIARILLGVMADILPDVQSSRRLARLLRALLDFLYLAQDTVHSTESLKAMDDALRRFHENKDILIELGIWRHFQIPKLHSLLHYTQSIALFGTADNYNTEQSECLHIDFTKNAFRASNFKDESKQMTKWLERLETMHQHAEFISWCQSTSPLPTPPLTYLRPNLMLSPFLTTHPSEKGITFESLYHRYGAIDFQDALADFIVQHNHPELSTAVSRRRANNTLLLFQRVAVFHKIKFTDPDDRDPDPKIVDVLHIRPEVCSRRGTTTPGRFDTALVKNGSQFRVAQIRVVFQLPKSALSSVFLSSRPAPPTDLAYIEWFTPFSRPDESHGMHRVSRSLRNGRRLASIVPLAEVCRSVQLFPVFGPVTPPHWQGSTVLEECRSFYVNPFLDRHLYRNLNVISGNL
ncbi:hypothetical protein V8E53_001529 [Lactarius tabidus]